MLEAAAYAFQEAIKDFSKEDWVNLLLQCLQGIRNNDAADAPFGAISSSNQSREVSCGAGRGARGVADVARAVRADVVGMLGN
ncbi:hypothetical protein EVAR_11498_1 [Eumeta japonica]|uniref:Uncharacterized protein n=1 Tax=Eumeta variegata TaxID=151549 RepID=A0A4C1TZZ6_EUMVA|nr:hypothetical protein EVAR_11498_1 [Eumeta japonica]